MLVSYGTAATKNDDGNSRLPVLKSFASGWLCSCRRRQQGWWSADVHRG
jgi:hypothetical protein